MFVLVGRKSERESISTARSQTDSEISTLNYIIDYFHWVWSHARIEVVGRGEEIEMMIV